MKTILDFGVLLVTMLIMLAIGMGLGENAPEHWEKPLGTSGICCS